MMPTLRLDKGLVCLLLAALGAWALGGCGDASSEKTTIQLSSPAVGRDGVVSPQVRCGEGTIWIPLKWGDLPKGTEEAVIYFGRFVADEAESKSVRVPFGALFTKVDLALHGNPANQYPAGSTPDYFGRINCPPARRGQHFVVALFALDSPRLLPEPPDANFVTRLTEQLIGIDTPATSSPSAVGLISKALAIGSFTATYGKPR